MRKKVDRFGRTYDNLKEWVGFEENVYIARQGVVFVDNSRFPPKASIWANPYKVGPKATEQERDEIIGQYYYYIRDKIINENLFGELMALKGKNLGCWCYPKMCHGEVLIWLIDKYERDDSI